MSEPKYHATLPAQLPGNLSQWQWMLLCGAALVVMTIIAYLPAIGAGYIWDDDSYLTENALVQSPDGLGPIWQLKFVDSPDSALPVPVPNTPQYYPLVFSSFWVEHKLWGIEDASGYHLVNILLHGFNALLVWLVFRQLGVRGAWLIGAVFALHPVHVESVAWITERKNVLSGLFYLASALTWLRFDAILEQPVAQRRPGGPWPWYLLSLAVFVCALLSKTITCSLPAALILAMLLMRRRFTMPRVISLVPMFAVGLFFAWMTSSIEANFVGARSADVVDELTFSLPQRVLIASNALLFYVSKMVWPHPLVFIYPRWDIASASVLSWWTVLAVVGIGGAAVWQFMRGRRGIPLAMAYFAGTVLPALGLVALVYPHRFSFVADHFNYLASIGIIAIVVTLLLRLPLPIRQPRARWALAGVMLIVLGVLTSLQTRMYEDEETLWLDTIAHNRASWMPQNNLAAIYLTRAGEAVQRGDADAIARYAEKTREHASAAVRIKPDHDRAQNNLANALRLLGRVEDAIPHAIKAAELRPEQADYHVHLARLYRLDDAEDASTQAYALAVEHAPDSLRYRFEYADYLVMLERFETAMGQLRIIVEKEQNYVPALLLAANVREAQRRYESAEQFLAAAVRAATTPPMQVLVYPSVAKFYASCPDESIRDFAKARIAAEQLVRLTNGNHTALGVLADVRFRSGEIDQAIQTALGSAERAQDVGDRAFASRMLQQVELYRDAQGEASSPDNG